MLLWEGISTNLPGCTQLICLQPRELCFSSVFGIDEVIHGLIHREHLPAPGPDVLILRCGPLPMMKAMEGYLDDLGYTREVQFQF